MVKNHLLLAFMLVFAARGASAQSSDDWDPDKLDPDAQRETIRILQIINDKAKFREDFLSRDDNLEGLKKVLSYQGSKVVEALKKIDYYGSLQKAASAFQGAMDAAAPLAKSVADALAPAAKAVAAAAAPAAKAAANAAKSAAGKAADFIRDQTNSGPAAPPSQDAAPRTRSLLESVPITDFSIDVTGTLNREVDALPLAENSLLRFAVYNQTGAPGDYDVYFYKARAGRAQGERQRISVASGGNAACDLFLVEDPGQYRLEIRDHGDALLAERTWDAQ